MAMADSMDWEFNLRDFWLSKSRWSMMVKQYIDPEAFKTWLDIATQHIGVDRRGVALMRTREVLARGGGAYGNKQSRRWGSCMLGISYKALPAPQITLYSRTSYLGYLSAMDLSVAWMCGNYLGSVIGMPVEEMKFMWFNEALQFHNFKSLAYMLCNIDEKKARYYQNLLENKNPDDEAKAKIAACPAILMSRKWLQKLIAEDDRGESYGVTNYNTYRRIRRRYHTEVKGYPYGEQFEGWSYYRAKDKVVKAGGAQPGEQKEWFPRYKLLPSCNVKDLDFSTIKVPLGVDFSDEVNYNITDDNQLGEVYE